MFRRLGGLVAVYGALSSALASEPAPVIFQSGRGRFEVAALDPTAAQQVTQMAEDAWRLLTVPLLLPDSFSSPVYVRLVSGGLAGSDATFRVVVEAGGIVSVRISWVAAMPPRLVRRALVQALLMRLAVAAHGVNDQLAAPLWLEHGCVGWWETRDEPAQLDAAKAEARRLPLPSLAELLAWQRGDVESPSRINGSVWLLAFLQSEAAHTTAWTEYVRRILGGDDPLAVMAAAYGSHFSNVEEREMWWQTGGRQLRRLRTVPTLEATDSRVEIAALARFTFAQGETDVMVPLATVVAHGQEPVVRAELTHRAGELAHLLSSLHPFYRNAGLSLAEVFNAGKVSAEKRGTYCAVFERDWRDAVELEAAATAALESLDKNSAGLRPASVAPR